MTLVKAKGKNGEVPADLRKQVQTVEQQTRAQLASILGDKHMWDEHDELPSSLLQSRRLAEARRAPEPSAGEEFEGELAADEAKDKEAKDPVEDVEGEGE